jgi:dTDP-glucose 4,6-dehydratase
MSPPLPTEDLDQVLRQVGGLWDRLDGKRVLFTGASGFFGSWMLESLLHAGTKRNLPFQAIAVTRNAQRFSQKFPHMACDSRVDIMESDTATMPVPDGPVDYIVHSLVPDTGTPLGEIDSFFESATRRLLDTAAAKASQGLLLCSTGAVYQPADPPLPFSEEDPLVPLDGPLSYGQIRRKVEAQCLKAMNEKNVPVKIARGFAFVGPRLPLNANFAIGNFIRDALAGGPIVVKGDGTAVRSYLYAADMAVWLWTILFQGLPGRAFNVGSEEVIHVSDLASTIAGMLHVRTSITGTPIPGAAPASYVPRTRRAERELDLRAWTGQREGIEKTIHFSATGFQTVLPG